MEIDSFAKVFYPQEEGDLKLIWAETSFRRSNPNGATDSVEVRIALDDFSIAVSDIPNVGIDKSIEFLRAVLEQYDAEQKAGEPIANGSN